MSDYSDEAFGDAIATLRRAVDRLRGIRDAIDPSEPLRDRIEREVEALEASAAELERILEEAIDELL